MGNQEIFQKVDCNSYKVYSFTDDDCSKQCRDNNFISMHGVCTKNSTTITNKCDIKNGYLEFLEGDPELGTLNSICLSIDPGIQLNNSDQTNIICEGGEIDIDYTKSFPNVNQCKCSDSKIPILIENTSSVRKHAVCVDKNMIDVFNFNDLIV